jgi:tRNA splicing ligase
VARSYDKFFNEDEVETTQLDNMRVSLKYPVVAYIKENGFLGIMSGIQDENGTYKLFTASKSTNDGPYATNFRNFVLKHLVFKCTLYNLTI